MDLRPQITFLANWVFSRFYEWCAAKGLVEPPAAPALPAGGMWRVAPSEREQGHRGSGRGSDGGRGALDTKAALAAAIRHAAATVEAANAARERDSANPPRLDNCGPSRADISRPASVPLAGRGQPEPPPPAVAGRRQRKPSSKLREASATAWEAEPPQHATSSKRRRLQPPRVHGFSHGGPHGLGGARFFGGVATPPRSDLDGRTYGFGGRGEEGCSPLPWARAVESREGPLHARMVLGGGLQEEATAGRSLARL